MSETRREFLEKGVAAAAWAAAPLEAQASAAPWYRRTYRWGQTNITEMDPARYDIPWWREFWKRTLVEGVILNAGGIVAYYPSKFPLQHRAEGLGNRDLFGELTRAAHEDGLVVLARMDSNRAAEDFYRAHPDWFARDASGAPYRNADKYVTCVNSAYYDEYLPAVMAEIVERSHPEGFTDNSWSGLGRESICYCANCERKFREKAGQALPRKHDWKDPVYRQWIEWSYARRIEIWDLNNRATKASGGPDCLWIGMNSGSVASQSRSFRDYRAIGERAQIIMLDHQSREAQGFQQNADAGKLIHGLIGWDKLIPESMAMYQSARNQFRVSAKPAAEARMWMIEGIAGGLQPWWHHIGAYHEDRRAYHTAEPVYRWHKANEQYLVDRKPAATVGLVWSQRNIDYYGQNQSALAEDPYNGFMQALVRARIPYVPVHADHIARDGGALSVLVLPNLAAMSAAQCEAVRRYVAGGGALISTGVTSLYDEWGDAHADFALADLFGAHLAGGKLGTAEAPERQWAAETAHSYLRLAPELRARVWGPKAAGEPPATGTRHAVLRGFDETDIMAFGGMLEPLRVDSGAVVPLTFVPPFPIFPPETSYMRVPKTDIPGLVLKGKVAYLAADIDRRFARDGLPDHGDLLANLVRWAAGAGLPLEFTGPGLIDCNLYTQPSRAILHAVNLTNSATRGPIEELLPVGPFTARLRLPAGVSGRRARLLVAGRAVATTVAQGWAAFRIESILDHEVVVVE